MKMDVKPHVLILEDNTEVLELLTDYLNTEFQIRCTGFSKVQDMLANFQTALGSQAAILDVELSGTEHGIDAYQILKSNHYEGQIYFLTGHDKSHPLMQEIVDLGVKIFEKPISAKKIANSLQSFLQASKVS